MNNKQSISIILPAKNESNSLNQILPLIQKTIPSAEIIVVNDGSTDDTNAICIQHGIKVISHPYNIGNGAAIKTGSRAAKGDILVFMDADGQHEPKDILKLLDKIYAGYDMVVGARGSNSQASILRFLANNFYNRLASLMTGFKIQDLTSGFRAVRARHFKKFLYLLPNGFSYPTTSTMAFFRSGLTVAYVPIHAKQRDGKSHIKLLKDGIRFFVIILKIGALFSPMRLFLPVSLLLFFTGLSYYGFTYFTVGRFTNMSTLLFISSLIIFMMGLLSEQIASLHYKQIEEDQRRTRRD